MDGRSTRRPPHILVVEDDGPTRSLLSSLLADEGYQVTAVGDGATALSCVRQAPPDLILLDLLLPVMTGASFAATYRQEPGDHAPIILLSGLPSLLPAAEAIEAAGAVAKPFDLDHLLAVVARLLAGDAAGAAPVELSAAPRAPGASEVGVEARALAKQTGAAITRRRRSLQRLGARVARLRQEIAAVADEARRLYVLEASRPLTAAERDHLRAVRLDSQRLRDELELLAREFEQLRASSPL